MDYPILTLAQVAANLLALPKTYEEQAQAANAWRSLASQTPGINAETLNAVAPEGHPFPGSQVPGLGQVLGGIGTTGQLLQNVLGNRPDAPRPPLGAYIQLQNLQAQRDKTQAAQRAAGMYTNPRAKALAGAGQFGAAESLETGKLGPSGELQQLIQEHLDEGMDLPAARSQALKDIDTRRLARAKAQAGITVGARLSGEQQGFTGDKPYMGQFFPQKGPAPAPAPGPQPVSGVGPSTFQPGVYRIGTSGALEPAESPMPGRKPVSGRLQLPGGSTVEFENPQVGNEFAAVMRAQNVDPQMATPEDSQRVLAAWQAYQGRKEEIQQAVQRTAGRLPDTDRNAITALKMFQDQVYRLMHDFTPEERAQYTGVFRYPAYKIAQLAQSDPRFLAFSALLGEVEAAKFGEGGKQLTPLEAQVVESYIPTGREWSGAPGLEAKAGEFQQRVDSLIRSRLALGTMSAGEAQQQYEKDRMKYLTPGQDKRALAEKLAADVNAGRITKEEAMRQLEAP